MTTVIQNLTGATIMFSTDYVLGPSLYLTLADATLTQKGWLLEKVQHHLDKETIKITVNPANWGSTAKEMFPTGT